MCIYLKKETHILRNIRCYKGWPLTATLLDETDYNTEVGIIERVAVNGYPFGRETHLHLSRFPELQLLCRSCSFCLCAHVAAWKLYQHLHPPYCVLLLLAYVVAAALAKRMSEDITKSTASRDQGKSDSKKKKKKKQVKNWQISVYGIFAITLSHIVIYFHKKSTTQIKALPFIPFFFRIIGDNINFT